MEQLPSEFDLIIVGTGLIESILSAAASRVGKTVLHIDNIDYYGGQWASFNLKALNNFAPKISEEKCEEGDGILKIGNNVFNIKDFQTKWHIPEKKTLNKIPVEENLGTLEDESKKTEITENLDTEKIKDCPDKYFQETLLKESRRFNIDLSPRLHFARGDFVELLISSNIARYSEYRSVSQILTWLNGSLEVVPCSRSDVFANNKVTVIEKRMLMKLFTSLDANEEESKKYEYKTFKEFLKDKKLTTNLIHYVLYAISRSTDQTPYNHGIIKTKRFLNSLGRFGKTPFLFSMYGSGETTQAFCRLSAVFGGIFALNQESLSALKTEENKITAIINGGQEIKAENFVLSAEKSPKEFISTVEITKYISRAVFITNRSIFASESEHLTLLMYPPEDGKNLVTVIETGPATGTCPKGLYIVHFITKQEKSPKEDFEHVLRNLFESENNVEDNVTDKKPKIFWSCYFSLPISSDFDLNEKTPSNLYLCSGPDLDLDYDCNIKKAESIFKKIYPDLEFLPRAPDPEEIIIGVQDEEPNTNEDFKLEENQVQENVQDGEKNTNEDSVLKDSPVEEDVNSDIS